MHLEILDERRIHLVRELAEIPEKTCFYLAGGTALSLQLGLRKSYDFDFFSEQRFNSNAILARLKERWADLTVIHMDQDTCDVILDGVQTSFLW
ncbi:MAG: nucleotidyl transferase AbiEii/AbiGii toxin family protein [Clostridia bacterium]|nr:nucleotidyl transferase AbiEii/AbiGii toxin family protein [Clostridia bacterium]